MDEESSADGVSEDSIVTELSDAASVQRYTQIFTHSNDAILVVDLETDEIVDANPAATQLLGYSRSELRSMSPESIHPEDIERIRDEFISEVRDTGSGFTEELTCLTKNGATVPTEISGALLTSDEPDQTETRMIAMLRDVSERVEYRSELENRVERLDRFAQVVSHDLQNLISIVDGHVRLARETGEAENFDAVENAVERMEEMVSTLLQLTKEGELVAEETVVQLESVARDAWECIDSSSAVLEVEDNIKIRADRARLVELFENLFSNAITHNEPEVTITVGAVSSEDATGVYISDDGSGIAESAREDLFEWGYTTDTDGTGFGLAIVDNVARGHGWSVRVTNSEHGGARFELLDVSVVTDRAD